MCFPELLAQLASAELILRFYIEHFSLKPEYVVWCVLPENTVSGPSQWGCRSFPLLELVCENTSLQTLITPCCFNWFEASLAFDAVVLLLHL